MPTTMVRVVSFIVSYLIQIHILYAAWCCQVRLEGQQYLSRPLSLRHWLSGCAVAPLCVLYCHVPIRCNTCQSYSINTMMCCPLPPPPPSNTQGYAVRRHDDAVLRGAVGAEDDGARVVIHISRLRQWL